MQHQDTALPQILTSPEGIERRKALVGSAKVRVRYHGPSVLGGGFSDPAAAVARKHRESVRAEA